MGLREIDKEATKLSKKLTDVEKGIVRTAVIGGGIDKQEIAEFNEDVDERCGDCDALSCTSSHIAGACPFFDPIRKETDPELAKVPLN